MAQVLSIRSKGVANGIDLERWYIGLSILLGFGVILVPTILGHFGKNTSRGGNSNNSFWYVIFTALFSADRQLVQARYGAHSTIERWR